MKRAFTLIELLIVIAIIAILALIAIPNFLAAQVRAKVSRVQADFRTIAAGVEAYFVDQGVYPFSLARYAAAQGIPPGTVEEYENAFNCSLPQLECMRAPIMYLNTDYRAFGDPFEERGPTGKNYQYTYTNLAGTVMHLKTKGPNNWNETGGSPMAAPDFRCPVPLRFNGSKGTTYNSVWCVVSMGPDRKYQDPRNDDPTKNTNCLQVVHGETEFRNFTDYGRSDFYDPSNGTVSTGNIWRFSSGGAK